MQLFCFVSVTEIGLQLARIVSLVRQRVSAGVAEHVRMRFEA
jgi:hypothetical protein